MGTEGFIVLLGFARLLFDLLRFEEASGDGVALRRDRFSFAVWAMSEVLRVSLASMAGKASHPNQCEEITSLSSRPYSRASFLTILMSL